MRSIRSRIERLEHRSDTEMQESLQFVLTGVQTRMSLPASEAELKRYLQEHAEEICA